LALSLGTSRLPYASFVNVSRNPDILDTLPVIDTDPFGHVHIAWWGTHVSSGAPDGVATDVFYSHGVNQTFSVPISIPITTGYYSKDTTLAVDKDGYAHVAFRRSEDQIWDTLFDDIFYATNRGNGIWRPILVVDGGHGGGPEAAGPRRPSIAVDDSGTVHLIFLGSAGTQIFYTHNATGVFATPMAVPGGEVWAVSQPKIAVDRSGHVHIAFQGRSPTDQWGDIFYTNNVGGTFGPPTNVSNEAGPEGGAYGMSLAVDNYGKAHIVYGRQSWPQICYVTNEHGDFAPPICFGSYGDKPEVAADADGHVHIAYRGYGYNVMYANNAQGSFEPVPLTDFNAEPDIAATNVGESRWFAVGTDGSVHVVFHVALRPSEDYEIYYLGVPSLISRTPTPTSTSTPSTATITPTRTATCTPSPTTWGPSPTPGRERLYLPLILKP
jgi:hypothetical protein